MTATKTVQGQLPTGVDSLYGNGWSVVVTYPYSVDPADYNQSIGRGTVVAILSNRQDADRYAEDFPFPCKAFHPI